MNVESDYLEILADCAWKHPSNYGGFSPDGDYLIYCTNGNISRIAEEVNFRVAERLLRQAVKDCAIECDGTDRDDYGCIIRPDWVYTWRARHWAVGHQDYLMVRNDAPDSILIAAAEIVASLADYPILSDDEVSEAEWDYVTGEWARMSIRDRVELLQNAEMCIFIARRDEFPTDDSGYLFESILGDA